MVFRPYDPEPVTRVTSLTRNETTRNDTTTSERIEKDRLTAKGRVRRKEREIEMYTGGRGSYLENVRIEVKSQTKVSLVTRVEDSFDAGFLPFYTNP